MADNLAEGWREVREALKGAESLAWDGCHKIYILLDAEQTEEMRSYGYDENHLPGGSRLHPVDSVAEPFELLREWFDDSCGLRFISSVSTNHEDPNAGFTHLITQFADEDEDEPPDED